MKTQTKKDLIYERIETHGENLNIIFHTGYDTVDLCKKLRRLESIGNKLALNLCNGTIEQDFYEVESEKLLIRVNKLLGFRDLDIPVFHNGDPRGYALKIDDEYMRAHNINLYRDWGGYGIIAPDLTEG